MSKKKNDNDKRFCKTLFTTMQKGLSEQMEKANQKIKFKIYLII